MKGREKGKSRCMCRICERKREQNRVIRLCEIVEERYRMCVSLCRRSEKKRETDRVGESELCEGRERRTEWVSQSVG